jgi:hypothetical protein
MMAEQPASGPPRGITTVFGHRFDTTGLLGLSNDDEGNPQDRGFPAWQRFPASRGWRWDAFGTSSLRGCSS